MSDPSSTPSHHGRDHRIDIDDELYREVKAKAARSGRTVASVLEDAVRQGLHAPRLRGAERYVVRPFGQGGLRPGVDLAISGSVYEAMDEGGSGDAPR